MLFCLQQKSEKNAEALEQLRKLKQVDKQQKQEIMRYAIEVQRFLLSVTMSVARFLREPDQHMCRLCQEMYLLFSLAYGKKIVNDSGDDLLFHKGYRLAVG